MNLMTDNATARRLIDAAPPLRLSASALQQVVGWSTDDQPITLATYLAAQTPEVQGFQLSTLSEEQRQSVRRVEDLSDEELRKVVKLRLRQGSDGLKLAVLGQGELSVTELEKEIDAHSDVGQRLTAAERSNLILLQRLAEAGKIRSLSGTEATLEVPPLPF